MSELISKPQSQPVHESARPDLVAGAGEVPSPTIVVRYDAAFDASDQSGGDEQGAVIPPAGGARRPPPWAASSRVRAGGLLSLAWYGARTAYRYPRWAMVIAFSVT